MPIPILPSLASGPYLVYWSSIRQPTRLVIGALVADAFETPKELVWNDANLPPEDEWDIDAMMAEAALALVRSISDSLREEPILILVQSGTLCEGAWKRLRPLIPCASVGSGFTYIHGSPTLGSPAFELGEAVSKGQADRMFSRLPQIIAREASRAT